MEKTKEEDQFFISPISSALAIMFLEEAIDKGKVIEIPSLGIKISPEQKKE